MVKKAPISGPRKRRGKYQVTKRKVTKMVKGKTAEQSEIDTTSKIVTTVDDLKENSQNKSKAKNVKKEKSKKPKTIPKKKLDNKITCYFSPSRLSHSSIPISENDDELKLENPKNLVNGALKELKPAQRNGQLTDYFPIRRSHRKPKTTILQEKQKEIEDRILDRNGDGLKVHNFEGKGRGVVTTRCFQKGEMVVEYIGELIAVKEAKKREMKYSQDSAKGCYMYYFSFQGNQYCIDATEKSDYLGRLVNHSRFGNLSTKTVEVKGKPHLILLAKKDIPIGSEVLYDYGDRSKEALEHHPWLAF